MLIWRRPSCLIVNPPLSCLVSTFWDICDGCEWMQEGGPEDVACAALQASKTQGHKTKLTTRMRRGYCMKTTISLEAQLGKFAMVDI